MDDLSIIERAKHCVCDNACFVCEYKDYYHCYKHLISDLLSVIDFQKEMLDATIAGQETLQKARIQNES